MGLGTNHTQWLIPRYTSPSRRFTPCPDSTSSCRHRWSRQIVNLRLNRQPIEPAVRSLISTIGYQNFALVYDPEGRPHSAVVLSAPPHAVKNSATKAAAPVAPLTIEERDRLKKELDRWNELKQEERSRIEERLRKVPPSEDREILVREYGRQVLAAKCAERTTADEAPQRCGLYPSDFIRYVNLFCPTIPW